MTAFKTLTEIADTSTPFQVDLCEDVKTDSVVRYYRTPSNLFDVQTITVASPTVPKSTIHVSASIGSVKHTGSGYLFSHTTDFAKASSTPELVTSLVHLVAKEDAVPLSVTPAHLALVPKVSDEIGHIFGILGIRSLLGDSHKTTVSEYDLDVTVQACRNSFGASLSSDIMSLHDALHHRDFNDETEVVIAEKDGEAKSATDLHRLIQLMSQLGDGAAVAIPSTSSESRDIIVKWKDVSLTMQKLHASMVAATPECSVLRVTFTFPERLQGKETVVLKFTQSQHSGLLGQSEIDHSSNILSGAGTMYDKDAVVKTQDLDVGSEHLAVSVTKPHWYSPFTNAIAPMLTKVEDAGANFLHPLYNDARTAWHAAKADVMKVVAELAVA
jgi:hypothetical protein